MRCSSSPVRLELTTLYTHSRVAYTLFFKEERAVIFHLLVAAAPLYKVSYLMFVSVPWKHTLIFTSEGSSLIIDNL